MYWIELATKAGRKRGRRHVGKRNAYADSDLRLAVAVGRC